MDDKTVTKILEEGVELSGGRKVGTVRWRTGGYKTTRKIRR